MARRIARPYSRQRQQASNYVKGPVGNVIVDYGSFNAIIRPKYAASQMLLSPADSWRFSFQWPNCTGWVNCTLGTVDHHLHTLYVIAASCTSSTLLR
jgi:hypothetical protein